MRSGWITYLTRLQQPHEIVAIEFLQNLQEDHSIVRGKRITITDAIIAEVSGLPVVGPTWTHKKLRIQETMAIFQDEGQHLIVKGKGVQPATLGEPWTELARVVWSYITCDGRKDVVRPRHLKLLAVLKQKCVVNLPTYLNFLLRDAAQSIRKSHHIGTIVSHHYLIRLIVSYSLAQQKTSWQELVFSIDAGMALPAPK